MPNKSINEILDLVKNMLEEAGFQNIQIDIQGKTDDNTYMIKVVTSEDSGDVNLGLIPISFDSIGGEVAVILPDDTAINQLAARAGLKRYKIAGKVVYASSEEEALKKISKKIKYPYVTLTGEVLRNPDEFINHFSTALKSVKKASEEVISETEQLLLEAEKEANPENIVVSDSTFDTIVEKIVSGELGKKSSWEGAYDKLIKAIELAQKDEDYKALAYKMRVKGGIIPLDKESNYYIVYGELGPEFLATKEDDHRVFLRKEEYELLRRLESIISGQEKVGSYLIEDLLELAEREDVSGVFSDERRKIEELVEDSLGVEKEVEKVSSKLVASLKEAASQYGINKEISFTVRRASKEKGILYVDGEVQIGNSVLTYASIRANKDGIIVDTPAIDILVREHGLKKYKLGSVVDYATSEDEFLAKVLDEVEPEVKEANLKPIHIIGNDGDSKVTFWMIKEENGKYYLERLENQTLIQ